MKTIGKKNYKMIIRKPHEHLRKTKIFTWILPRMLPHGRIEARGIDGRGGNYIRIEDYVELAAPLYSLG